MGKRKRTKVEKTSRTVLAGCLMAGLLLPGAAWAETGAAAETQTAPAASAPASEGGSSAVGSLPALVPLREASEQLGAVVIYKSSDRSVSIQWAGRLIRLSHEGITVEAEGQQTAALSAKPTVGSEGRLYLPLDAFRQAFGIQADWSDKDGIEPGANETAARAALFMRQLASGKVQDAGALLDSQLAAVLPPDKLAALPQQIVSAFGPPARLDRVSVEDNGVHVNAKLSYTSKLKAPFAIEIRFNHDGEIDDLYIPSTPEAGYAAPDYDDPSAYAEEQVTVGEGTFALPGTLTIPASGEPSAVAVLVHGSGPEDRDESIGAAKTFRDLAVGLAKEGIATIRYEKRTREHTMQSATPDLTVNEETIDDALLAAEKVRSDPRFAGKPVVVIGHSQGAMLVPRLLNQDKDKAVDAAVLMAGPAEPLEDLMLTQYENAVDRAVAAGQPDEVVSQLKQQAEAWKMTLGVIKNEAYTADDYPANLRIPNARWWFDFRNYNGPEIARTQSVPLFILQGANDVQVDASNLDGWKSALAGRADVQYELYPKLNHLFVPSDQPSTGAEYFVPGNVPLQVSEDIASWIGKLPKK
ncbi:alpha/beta fold hydrolase [Cohnella zeiphila]|uniref:Alpha/beta fold hydrolase n=1 Tax=Cohnella zeiphila TaxID=2761120 RepID=A0A7X0W0L5_9BACL|nr:alpha/beta fold hydrolase [Cohnella zeiphila]MBB6735188.1 alpha/beta fold hydrolase [Cohnella zeiphila]